MRILAARSPVAEYKDARKSSADSGGILDAGDTPSNKLLMNSRSDSGCSGFVIKENHSSLFKKVVKKQVKNSELFYAPKRFRA